jgi:hypothetical protein
MDEHGFTNDEKFITLANQWKDDAIIDGWSIYPDKPNEDIYFLTHPEGFRASGYTKIQEPNSLKKFHVRILVWGPDRLAIKSSLKYNMNNIRKGLKICNYCNNENIETMKVGFDGRACLTCQIIENKKAECTNSQTV